MKTYFKNIKIGCVNISCILICILLVVACSSTSSPENEFIKQGRRVYPQKASSVRYHPGHNRVKISWVITDPLINKAVIYWRNKSDSSSVSITQNKEKGDTVSTIIDNLAEGDYTFTIRNINKNGDYSIPSEISGHVYGKIFVNNLKNRFLLSITQRQDLKNVLDWQKSGDLPGVAGTVFKYKTPDGVTDSVIVPADSNSYIINILNNGNRKDDKLYSFSAEYYTIYVPTHQRITLQDTIVTASIDTFASPVTKISKGSEAFQYAEIDKSHWKMNGWSDQQGPYRHSFASNIIDGSWGTFWNTKWINGRVGPPHTASIDMDKKYWVHGFVIVKRAGHSGQDPHDITMQFSNDGQNWNNGEDFVLPFPNVRAATIHLNKGIRTRYFKLIIRSMFDPSKLTTDLAEISAF